MSQVMKGTAIRAAGLLLLALLALGCSKKRGTPFDPDAGHPEGFFMEHPAAFRASRDSCATCHGDDLRGGINKVSCFSASFEGTACHPGGPGGHPPDWRATHSVTDPAQAPMCAVCHKNPANTLPPNCFNNSLCHGPRSGHPPGWRTQHIRVNPAQASMCAQCHKNPANNFVPGCFNNSLCHGPRSPHPPGWITSHSTTDQGQAPFCAQCHDNPGNNLPPGCFNGSLCHGPKSPHPAGWLTSHTSTDPSQAPTCAKCHDNPKNNLPPGCFNTSLCHGIKSGHPAGWSSPTQHGAAAKGSPGMASCTVCHGADYTGDGSGQSCFPCHGWNAPHGKNGWQGGGTSHRSTLQANAGACAPCHRSNPGTPGCFNATLCHGSD